MFKPYTKKPVTVEAVQYDGTFDQSVEILKEISENTVSMITSDYKSDHNLIINTLEGKMKVNPTDYIIKGVKGEYYPCRADIFQETYEEA